MAAAVPRPTQVRYVVLALTTMVAVLLYLDRICLSFAELYVREELGISRAEMAFVLSSFFLTYAVGQLPAGWLSDRYGARLMLALYLAIWSAFTGLMGFAFGIVTLVALRLGCGLFEAGAYPAAAGVIGHWIPSQHRGLASGIVSVGGRLGGAAAPILFPILMVAFVPISSSSLLLPADILDAPRLFPHLAKPPNAAPAPLALSARMFERLPAALQAELGDEAMSVSPAFKARLAETVNSFLGLPAFLEGIDLGDLNLPREALALLAPADTTRSAAAIERRNRLVLEVAFPDAVRKLYGTGWRPVMMVFCLAGLLVAVIFWWFFRDSPREHPGCNADEIVLIEGGGSHHDPTAPPAPLPFRSLLTSGGLWISSLVQLLTNFGWAFLITWLTDYLRQKYQVPPITLGFMTSLPILVGIPGMFCGGLLTDYMTRRLGKRWGRAAPLALTRFVVAGAFITCIFLDSPWPVTLAMALVALATDLGTPAIWAYSLDVGGKHVGSVLGWSNMFGNIGAFLSPMLAVPLIKYWGSDGMFLTFAAALALAGILSLFLDANAVVVPDQRVAA